MGFKLNFFFKKSDLVYLKFYLKGTKIFKNLMKFKETNQIIIIIIIGKKIEKTKKKAKFVKIRKRKKKNGEAAQRGRPRPCLFLR
jgi:hypothetical protein